MEVRSALKSQYHAALKTLHQVIEKCPDAMWNDPNDGAARFWRVAYHTLFYAHFYLQQDEKAFIAWSRHRDEAQFIQSVPWDGHRPPKSYEPYTRDELLAYCDDCNRMIDAGVDALDLSAPQCGFPWYRMPTLEHQLVNIRHIQHHSAALSSRLRRSAGIEIDWVGKG
jgi:DinB superfamily